MWDRTCIPRKIYQVLYPCKRHFRCAQAQHFLVFCWLVIALIRDPGKGTIKGLGAYLPLKLPYWTALRCPSASGMLSRHDADGDDNAADTATSGRRSPVFDRG